MTEQSLTERQGFENTRLSTLYRVGVVFASLAVFVACLTQMAFVSPGTYFDHGYEASVASAPTSAIEQLGFGWMALPIAVVTLFNPPLAIAVAVTGVFTYKKWRIASIASAFITFGLMVKYQTLGFASWSANPLIAAAWLLYYFERRRPSFVCTVVALGLMLSFLSVKEIPFGPKMAGVPITTYEIGYWL